MLVGCIVGLVGSTCVILLNIKFVHWLFSLVPVGEYASLTKVGIVFIDLWLTLGLCLLPFLLGFAIGTILETK